MSLSTHHIIPEGERHCIWMDAGVADYKLCNQGFQCDECSFDAQMRRESGFSRAATELPVKSGSQEAVSADDERARDASAHEAASSHSAAGHYARMIQHFLHSVDAAALPEDRSYSANHTWAKTEHDELHDELYVIGIDHFVGTMLEAAHSVAFSVPPTHIKANDPYAWIVANGETLALRSPIAGTIVENNPALAEHSSLLHSDPYTQGWIVKIRAEEGAQKLPFAAASAFAATLHQDAARFGTMIGSEFQAMQPGTAGTMYDGGTVVNTCEDMLGTKKYFALLERFLRPRGPQKKEAFDMTRHRCHTH